MGNLDTNDGLVIAFDNRDLVLGAGANDDPIAVLTNSYFDREKLLTTASAVTANTATGKTVDATVVKGMITDINGKQNTLVSGTNIKTINSTSLLGGGNISINPCPYGVFGGSGGGAVTIGEGVAVASGDRCLAVGDAVARGDDSLAVGSSAVEAGSNSIAFGFAPNWEGDGEFIKTYTGGLAGGCAYYGGKIMTNMPPDEHTDGWGAMAFGFADSYGIIKAEGNGARAQGFSRANNSQIYAAEDGSIAEGYAYDESSIVASGIGAHAEGCASSDNANIRATNRGAHAEGSADEFSTILASGIGAHAEGMADISGSITASGDGSHAEGYGTIAQNNYEHAQGAFNKSNLTSAGTATQQAAGSTRFSVGIGTANNARANAIEIMVNGDTYIKGVGGYDGTNATAATASTLQSVISSKQDTLTSGTNIKTIDSNSIVGSGNLALNDIKYTSQSLTEAQRSTSRGNIKAMAGSHSIELDEQVIGGDTVYVAYIPYYYTELPNTFFIEQYNSAGDHCLYYVSAPGFVEKIVKVAGLINLEFNEVVDNNENFSLQIISRIGGTVFAYSLSQNKEVSFGENPESYEIYRALTPSVPSMVSTTWSALKSLRGSSGLTPGMQYRITDYNCTTSQANTQSANHQFDIIVTADDNHTLNENARAVRHSGDTYFSGCTLEAWELKYDIDNDANKYAWAVTGSTGRGVIYYMKDEWNNECPYDFKNIQFINNSLITYTFSYEDNYDDATLLVNQYCKDNIIRPYIKIIDGQSVSRQSKQYLNNIRFVTTGEFCTCYNNTFGSDCHDNFFEGGCYNNYFGGGFCNNSFGSSCRNNHFGAGCEQNTFGDSCYDNFFGNSFSYNTLGVGCRNNTFGNSCQYITFGNYCSYNTFEDLCRYIKFGNSSTVKSYYSFIKVEGGNQYIYLYTTQTTSSAKRIRNVTIAQGVNNTDSYKTITFNTRAATFQTIFQPANSQTISV